MEDVLDRQRFPGTTTAERFDYEPTFDQPLVHAYTSSTAPRSVPGGALAGATLTWLAAVYGLCYLVLPLVAAALGLHTVFIGNLLLNTLAFVPMALFTAGLVAVIRPEVVTSTRAPRDPVIAATLGSLAVWFGAHELSPFLSSVTAMPFGEMVTFVGMNVIEAGMIGAMLASFAKSPGKAFMLGAAFQTLLVSLFLGWIL